MSSEQYSVVTKSSVTVFVSSSINTYGTENRFQKDLTIADLKAKLELVTGACPGSMQLDLYSKDNQLVTCLANDSALLGSYPIDDGMRIHVTDKSIRLGEYEDVSKVEKFEITEAEYEKKSDSVRAFKKRHNLGRFADNKEKEENLKKEQIDKEKCETMKEGDRCEVTVPGQMTRRGTVKYIGQVDFKPGYWVGIHYDEPLGKNNGSVQGKKYFECPDKYGGFLKPEHVSVGDFPEEDLGLSDEDDEI